MKSQTVHSIEEIIGMILKYLDKNGLAENALVIYTSDQGFFLGEHGWSTGTKLHAGQITCSAD